MIDQRMGGGYNGATERDVIIFDEADHLHPLADRGPGYTKMEDVAVLCRNCHGLAHSENPPITLDRLASMKKSRKPKATISMM